MSVCCLGVTCLEYLWTTSFYKSDKSVRPGVVERGRGGGGRERGCREGRREGGTEGETDWEAPHPTLYLYLHTPLNAFLYLRFI